MECINKKRKYQLKNSFNKKYENKNGFITKKKSSPNKKRYQLKLKTCQPSDEPSVNHASTPFFADTFRFLIMDKSTE